MPATGRAMTARKRLNNRRPALTFDLEVAGLRYTATAGYFPDGKIGELFLNNHKSNSAADTNALLGPRHLRRTCSCAPAAGILHRRNLLSLTDQGRRRRCHRPPDPDCGCDDQGILGS